MASPRGTATLAHRLSFSCLAPLVRFIAVRGWPCRTVSVRPFTGLSPQATLLCFSHSGSFLQLTWSRLTSARSVSFLFWHSSKGLAQFQDEFEAWFHRVRSEANDTLTLLIDRLEEASQEIGATLAFYWEEELSGTAGEGAYTIESSKIIQRGQASGGNGG